MGFGERRLRFFSCLCCCLFLSLFAAGCGGNALPGIVVLDTGPKENELFSLDSASCTKDEILIYLAGLEGDFHSSFGDISLLESRDGVDFLAGLEEEALSRISRVKAMGLLAKERGVALTPAEESACEKAAALFLEELPPGGNGLFRADAGLLYGMYADYLLSEKLYLEITLSVDPEISDDEARVIQLEQIFIKGYRETEEGERQPLSGTELDALRIMAGEIQREAVSGEQSFEALIAMYNEAGDGSLMLSASEAPQEVLSLSRDEISPVVETSEGFGIYRCVSPVVEGQTETNKARIVEIRRQEAFLQEYTDFAQNLSLRMDEELWKGLRGRDYSLAGGTGFFRIYDTQFRR